MTGERRLPMFLMIGIGLVGVVASLAAPSMALLGKGPAVLPSAAHAMTGTAALFLATVTAYLGLRLYRGVLHAYRDLAWLSIAQAFLVGATIGFGPWLLPFYRAAEGPRDYFLRTNPALHTVYFEFKELAGLQAFALSVAGAVLIVRERDALQERDDLRRVTGLLLITCWLFLGAAYGLGAALTKLRSV